MISLMTEMTLFMTGTTCCLKYQLISFFGTLKITYKLIRSNQNWHPLFDNNRTTSSLGTKVHPDSILTTTSHGKLYLTDFSEGQ